MCNPLDVNCARSILITGPITKIANSALDEIRKSAADMATTVLKTLGTFWLKVPSPQLGAQTGASGGAIGTLQASLAYFTVLAAVTGLILCGARIAMTSRGEAGIEGVKMLVRLIGVTAAGTAVVGLLIAAGDAFAPWIITQATGQSFEQTAPDLLTNAALIRLTPLLTIVTAIFAVLGAAAMVVFMIIRGGLLVVLVAVWPLAASLSATEQGLQWYRKINAWLIAFVLLKPVAAIIYAAGFVLLKGGGQFSSSASTDAVMSTLTGTAILALAGLSLPAMLRFVAPMTAAGSGAMSGAAIGAATVAVGAAVVTGGGSAAAGGAAASAGGASSAGAGVQSGGGVSPGGATPGGGSPGGGGPAGGDPSGGGSPGGGNGGGGGGGEPSGGGSPGGGGVGEPAGVSSGGGTSGGAPVGGSPGGGTSGGAGRSGGGSPGGGVPGSAPAVSDPGSSSPGSSGPGGSRAPAPVSTGAGSRGGGRSSGSTGGGSSSGPSGGADTSGGGSPASGARPTPGGSHAAQVGRGLARGGRHVSDAATGSVEDTSVQDTATQDTSSGPDGARTV